MTELNTTKVEIVDEDGEGSENVVLENLNEPLIKVEEVKGKDFPCEWCDNISRTKSAKELHMKRNHNDKTIQYTPSPTNRKVGYTWFSCKNCKVKKRTENELKVHNKTVHMSNKNILPKETPKRRIQSYNCKDCNSTFDSRYKLTKHMREQHDGKVVKSPERKTPRTESKNARKAHKEELKVQGKQEESETDVKTVSPEVKELENLQDMLLQSGQENQQLKCDINKWIEFKDNMVAKLQKKLKEIIRT